MEIDLSSVPPGDLIMPDKIAEIFDAPRGAVDFRGAYGGRGAGRSYNFALAAAMFGYAEPLRILCTREYQASIRESFHAELRNSISMYPFLAAHYDIGVDYIRGRNGTEFMFRGLRHSMNAIKSMAHIDLTIIEEAEDTPEMSLRTLLPTVMRVPKAEVWALWNPRKKGSAVDKHFRTQRPPRSIVCELNYRDNQFFPPAMERLRAHDEEVLDRATYEWIWEGAYLENSKAQILADKLVVREFEPSDSWDGPYFGGDFGFSVDPSAAVKVWIAGDTLYVEYESGGVGIELDDLAEHVCGDIPNFDRFVSRWDNSRPESISYLKRNGLGRIAAAPKWPGSVEDGIAFLRKFRKIVVHPRCPNVAMEMRAYSYKVDRLTGDVLPTIVDALNHWIDAIRYALSPLIQGKGVPQIRVL